MDACCMFFCSVILLTKLFLLIIVHSIEIDSNLITEAEVIALLRSRPRVTTRDLIYELKKKLKKDERNKNILAMCVKKVATPVDGVLVLKDGF